MSDNQETSRPLDVWASGSAYEPYVGRWSRLVAREFIRWLAVPSGSRWLDVGSGTGALSQTILAFGAPSAVKGVDRADGYVTFAREQVRDERVTFELGDAHSLPAETISYDAVVSGLMLNFIPEPERAVAEMARVARPGAVVAAYVWDYADKMEFMRYFWDAAVALDPGIDRLDEGRRFPICRPEPLRQLFESAKLQQVDVRAIDIPTTFRDFDDYWLPFFGGQGPAPGYLISLPEEKQIALQEQIRSALPTAADGSISLIARAWAVRGVR